MHHQVIFITYIHSQTKPHMTTGIAMSFASEHYSTRSHVLPPNTLPLLRTKALPTFSFTCRAMPAVVSLGAKAVKFVL